MDVCSAGVSASQVCRWNAKKDEEDERRQLCLLCQKVSQHKCANRYINSLLNILFSRFSILKFTHSFVSFRQIHFHVCKVDLWLLTAAVSLSKEAQRISNSISQSHSALPVTDNTTWCLHTNTQVRLQPF